MESKIYDSNMKFQNSIMQELDFKLILINFKYSDKYVNPKKLFLKQNHFIHTCSKHIHKNF
jgi:hypothetical protein